MRSAGCQRGSDQSLAEIAGIPAGFPHPNGTNQDSSNPEVRTLIILENSRNHCQNTALVPNGKRKLQIRLCLLHLQKRHQMPTKKMGEKTVFPAPMTINHLKTATRLRELTDLARKNGRKARNRDKTSKSRNGNRKLLFFRLNAGKSPGNNKSIQSFRA